MCRSVLAILLLLCGGRAGAAEFSGFYAGVNAGYASRERTFADGPSRGGQPTSSAAAGPDLPPSAAGAAATMRRPGWTVSGRR